MKKRIFITIIIIGVSFMILNYVMEGALTARINNIYKIAGDPESIELIMVGYDYHPVNLELGKKVLVTEKEDTNNFCKIINKAKFENIESERRKIRQNKMTIDGNVDFMYFHIVPVSGQYWYVFTLPEGGIGRRRDGWRMTPVFRIKDHTKIERWVQEMYSKYYY